MSSHEMDEEVQALLGAADQRYTTGRRRPVAALQEGDGPLTVDRISAADETLAQSSSYRNLLEDARVVTNDDFARFELAEELTAHHHHLNWLQCGGIEFELCRRILCDAIGRDVAAGMVPGDVDALGGPVRAVSVDNARSFFGLA